MVDITVFLYLGSILRRYHHLAITAAKQATKGLRFLVVFLGPVSYFRYCLNFIK
jgi:hypothetical protein